MPSGGGFGNVLRRVFGAHDNPLSWGVPLGRVWGIRVRVHPFYLLYVGLTVAVSLFESRTGLLHTVPMMASLFVLVLLHEFGHCFGCRAVGGEADDILMWPLGGLAACAPPHTWRAHLVTVASGPAVNLALVPVTSALLLVIAGRWEWAWMNPLDGSAVARLASPVSIPEVIAYWLHRMNLVLLLFNVLVPMYPMDGGRIVQSVLWSRVGYRRSMSIAATTGLVAAGVLAVTALTPMYGTGGTMILGIAVFGGLVCWQEQRRLAFESAGYAEGPVASAGFVPTDRWEGEPIEKVDRRAERRREREAVEQAEIDRILEKIHRGGMGSLTGRERRTLERASKRRRDVSA